MRFFLSLIEQNHGLGNGAQRPPEADGGGLRASKELTLAEWQQAGQHVHLAATADCGGIGLAAVVDMAGLPVTY